MSRRLSRRLADALCAFRTGHSVRDLDRTRWRRVELLCRRVIAQDQRRIDADEFGILKIGLAPQLQAFRDDLHRFLQSRDRLVYRLLAKQIDLRRASLHSSRLHELARRNAGDNILDAAVHYVESLRVPPPETYGKLYEGLLEDGAFDHFLGVQRFRRLKCHLFLRAVSVWFGFRIRGEAR